MMDVGWSELARYLGGAFALYLVLEGILPFVNPSAAQRLMAKLANTEPAHLALDRAREKSQGANAIGTTGRGIGRAYEDKVARRALRVADLFHRERFAAKLGEILD